MTDEPSAPPPNHFAERMGFLRPDWDAITADLGKGPILTDAHAVHWLEHLVAHRGNGATWQRGDRFHVVEIPADPDNRHALRWAQDHGAAVLRHLTGIAEQLSFPLPVLLFRSNDDFLSYYADFTHDSELEELASAGGMFISQGFPHIATPKRSGLEEILAHELTHAYLSHLPLPLWLNEGFAVSMEQLLAGRSQMPTAADIAEHREVWDAESIQWFWTGAAFRSVELQRLAYQLAPVIVRGLSRNYEKLQRFANAAHYADAGEGACRVVYGRGIEGLVVPMLGEGPWQPTPDRWGEIG